MGHAWSQSLGISGYEYGVGGGGQTVNKTYGTRFMRLLSDPDPDLDLKSPPNTCAMVKAVSRSAPLWVTLRIHRKC